MVARSWALPTRLSQPFDDAAQSVHFRRFALLSLLLRDRAWYLPGDAFQGEAAVGQAEDASLPTESLCISSSPLRLCEPLVEGGIVYKVADNQHDRSAAFRLVHDAYVDAGLMCRNVSQMRVMPHHLLATTAVFVALDNDRVIATLSLVGDGRLGLPMESVYAREVSDIRQPDCWLGEVSALASAPASTAAVGLDVVVGLMRLMAQFSRRHGLDHLLVAVHPRHARFYERCLGFRPFGSEKAYPSVCDHPAVALHLDLSRLEEDPPATYGLFFGESIAEEHLRFCPISAAERRHFLSAVDSEESVAPVLACA
jgi:hypothetical protein